jgi:hypothetical protein
MQPAGHAGFLDYSCGDAGNIADNSITMNPLLRDFCQHQAWADAEHWRAIEAHPAAAQDAAIKNRLHHVDRTIADFRFQIECQIGVSLLPPLNSELRTLNSEL